MSEHTRARHMSFIAAPRPFVRSVVCLSARTVLIELHQDRLAVLCTILVQPPRNHHSSAASCQS